LKTATDNIGAIQDSGSKKPFLDPGRSFVLGFWLIVLPAYFLFCVLIKLYYVKGLFFFDVINDFWLSILKNFYFRFIVPELLLAGPVIALAVNFISLIKRNKADYRREASANFGLSIIICIISAGLTVVFLIFIFKKLL